MGRIRTNSGFSQNQQNDDFLIEILRKNRRGLRSSKLEKLTKNRMTKDTLYRQLKKLTNNKVISRTQDGKVVSYQLTSQRMIVKSGYSGITNRGHNIDNPEFCDVRIVLTISNPTKEKIGVSRIVVESSVREFPIPIRIRDWDSGRIFSSFVLEPQDTKTIVLFSEGLPIIQNMNLIPAIINIYDVSHEIIKKIKVKLHNTGFMII